LIIYLILTILCQELKYRGIMNKNLTMSIDERLLKDARKIALERNTTLTTLIRKFLQQLIEKEEHHKSHIMAELESIFDNSHAQIGIKKWSRDNLHER